MKSFINDSLITFPLLKSSSSVVKEHDYDAAKKKLTIKFSNGSIYKYQDVPANIAQGLETATKDVRLTQLSHLDWFHSRWLRAQNA